MVGAAVAVLVIAAVLLVVAGTAFAPLARTCAATLSEELCAAAVTATLGRGLPLIHPVILAAHAEPGPAGAAGLGQTATVTFDLLGVPGSTSVRLYLDMGGHWGGAVDRNDLELAVWTLLPLLLVVGIGVVMALLLARRRRHRAR